MLWSAEAEENIIAALGQRDRISEITLRGLAGYMMERFAALMEEPLPALTSLNLSVIDGMKKSLPEGFLGGSAPGLRSIALEGISFPALPNLVLSASYLQSLYLHDIPHAGYISPHEMVAFLHALPNLQFLIIGFKSPQSRPLQITPPPFMRAVLPALTDFRFKGVSEYLEDFVARIDTPLLDRLWMTLFLDLVFDLPRLFEFIGRTERLKPIDQAEMKLSPWGIETVFGSPTGLTHALELEIACEVSDWQVSSMARVCNQIVPLLSHVERLDICESFWNLLEWQDDADPTLWLELLNPFVSVKSLYVSEKLVRLVASALRELAGERVTEVLPALHDLFLEGLQPLGSVQEAINPFIAARQFSDHPIAIQRWDRMLESR